MADTEEDVNLPIDATTPSVTIDLAETRPATHAALDSVTPMGGDEIDIDAINARLDPSLSRAISVSSVRSDQPQTTLSELLQPMDADPFDEDQAELRFLHSKPTCFIVLGKPGAGKTALAKRLAQTWRCQLVHATDLIMHHIEFQTETGVKMQEILQRGGAVPEEMVARMIEDKINSPEVAHHGYVLDGFPSVKEDYLRVRDQLELIKNWKLKPDFIINLRIPDKDLQERRVNQRVDPNTNMLYSRDVWNPDKPTKDPKDDGEDDEDEEEEEEEHHEEVLDDEDAEEKVELNFEIVERLVTRPEDLEDQAAVDIKSYKEKLLRMFEDYMADHDQQYLIELDANKPGATLYKETMMRLNTFVLRRAAVPLRLQNQEEDEIPEDIETEELMRTLAGNSMVAPRYRWRRSKWARACPVELQRGNVVNGKPEYAVGFLDKIYVMSGPEQMELFLKNPRPYLISPQPRPPCKLCVTGPPLSGKTTMAFMLAQKFNARVLDVNELIKPRMEAHKATQVELHKKEALESAIATVQAKIREKEEMMRGESSSDEAPDPTEGTTAPASDTDGAGTAQSEAEAAEAEANKQEEAPTEVERGDRMTTDSDDEDKEEGKSGDKKDDEDGDTTAKEDDTATIGESTVATSQQPTETTVSATVSTKAAIETIVGDVDISHPEVQAMVDVAVKEAESQTYTLASEAYVEVLQEAITEIHKELRKKDSDGPTAGGWVIDNFPQTRDHWTLLIERGLAPDEVVNLKDTSENGQFLLKRWYRLNREDVDEKARLRREEEDQEKARVLEEASSVAPTDSSATVRMQDEKQKEEEYSEAKKIEEEAAAVAAEGGEEGEEGAKEGTEPAKEGEGETAEGGATEGGEQKEGEEGAKEGGGTEGPPSTIPGSAIGEAPKAPEPSDPTTTIATTIGDELAESTKDEDDYEGAEEDEQEHVGAIEDPLPPDGPETIAFKDLRNDYEREFPSVQAMLTGTINLEPIQVEVDSREVENIYKEAHNAVEQPFSYRPWEYTSTDVDEEDEDADADAEEEELEEEEDEEVAKNKRKQFGDTKHFCPVSYKENYVLWPGNPECAGKYREKVYYFNNADTRDLFLSDPVTYVAKGKSFVPPPVRIIILGPKGAGKSLHGRFLAEKLGIFHIDFKERLQELVIAKTKKKIGPEHEEEEEEPDSEPEGEGSEGKEGEEKPKAKEEKKPEEEEEEQEIELTEFEENIKGNLMEEEALSVNSIDNIVPAWWLSEPFKNTGFVLEGFPRTADEAQYLAERGLYPDACIILTVEDSDIVDRLLPPKMEKWRQKRDRRLARKDRRKARKMKEKEAAMEKRRKELLTEIAERKAERLAERAANRDSDESEHSDEELDDEEEEEDVDALLAEEFEDDEEEEEDDEEMEEDAQDRLKNEIGEVYDDDTSKLASVQETLEEILVPRIEMNAGRKPSIVRFTLEQNMKPIVDYRESLFEKVYPVKEPVAKKMLQIGYKHPSRFGSWCPVKLMKGDCIQPMQGPGYPSFPAVYRQHVYFLSTPAAREEFIMHPLKYLKLTSPKPVVPVRLAIIGPPKSGKTSLANRFVSEYGMLRLSLGEAVRFVQTQQPKTELALEIKAHLMKGLTAPDELSIRCLEVALLDMKARTRGYVLDGFPVTKEQVDLMTEHSIIPVVVLELKVDSRALMMRGMKDRQSPDRTLPLHDSSQIQAIKIAAWQKEITSVREWYKEQHRNWVPVDGERSKWWVWNRAADEGKRSVRKIQTYLQKVTEGKAAAIEDLCVTPKEFLTRLGDFNQYCPVSLAKDGALVDCSVNPTQEFAAEFRGRYYKMENQPKLEAFLSHPEKFVPPLAPRQLPSHDMLPRRRTQREMKIMFPIQIELQGYCPVTYLDGQLRYEAIVPGNPELIVEYRQKIYCFESAEKLQKFLKYPARYYDLKLPHKLPPKKDPLMVTSLPMLGYMEQTIAQAVTKSLTSVGCFKPKFPFLTPSRSAILYLAYHLKAYNPKSSEYVRKKYKRKLQQFEESCELIRYLGSNMSDRFRDPLERPIDFDHKMIEFLNLQGREPMVAMLA